MRVAPVSADLLIKLALGALLVGGAVWAVRRAASAGSDAAAALASGAWANAKDAAWGLSPTNQNNVIYQTANGIGGAIVTAPDGAGKNADGSWTLGGFVYDIFNPGAAQAVRDMTAPINTGGATGEW